MPEALRHRQAKALLQRSHHRGIAPAVQLHKPLIISRVFPAQRQSQRPGPLHQGHNGGIVGPAHQHQLGGKALLRHQPGHGLEQAGMVFAPLQRSHAQQTQGPPSLGPMRMPWRTAGHTGKLQRQGQSLHRLCPQTLLLKKGAQMASRGVGIGQHQIRRGQARHVGPVGGRRGLRCGAIEAGEAHRDGVVKHPRQPQTPALGRTPQLGRSGLVGASHQFHNQQPGVARCHLAAAPTGRIRAAPLPQVGQSLRRWGFKILLLAIPHQRAQGDPNLHQGCSDHPHAALDAGVALEAAGVIHVVIHHP